MNTNSDTDDRESILKKNKKLRRWDLVVTAVLAVGLIILYFFWGCSYDWIITAIAVVIAAAALLIGHFQYRKINELLK